MTLTATRNPLWDPSTGLDLLHLQAGGVSVVLDLGQGRLPTVSYWGESLGDLSDDDLADLVTAGVAPYRDTPFDVATRIAILPEHASAWVGRPGVEGSRAGRDWSTAFRVAAREVADLDGGGHRLALTGVDEVAALTLDLEIELLSTGLLRLRATLGNTGAEPFTVGAVRLALPVPAEAEELLDFTGRHNMERVPQRRDFAVGLHARENRTGRTGHDAAFLLLAGRRGFGFQTGETWGVHLGWSGNQHVYAERLYNGARLLGGGELLDHGEVRLGPTERYATPWLYATYGVGLNQAADRFHQTLRARPGHPRAPRPVILNTWEAVYFDHDLDRLKALADVGAKVGVERFVLDDGWFSGRRDDTSSLGDWTVSPDAWPRGLGPLIDHVHGLGMEFGLWVEPEMVNLDSALARAHPDWIFSAGRRVGLSSRYQHVLDLGHPGAYRHVLDSLDALLKEFPIGYLKWDHNRFLNDAGHTPDGEAGVHRHTLAVYRLMDELRRAHPDLEIESCAAGGGRVDLGVLARTDRVWASDCIDPLERQQIVRYTQLILPPELIGTHIGSPTSHTTGRHHVLPFRAQTALWGHLGIEWDLTGLDEAEVAELSRWVDLHKRLRPLLHGGTVVHADHPDPAVWISGVVARDGSEAVYGVTAVGRSVTWPPGRARLPGLDPERSYQVVLDPLTRPDVGDKVPLPPWVDSGVRLPGRVLGRSGLELLPILPEHSYLLRLSGS